MIKSNLRKTTYHCKTIDQEVNLVEMSYGAQMDMLKANQEGRPTDVAAIIVKHGVEEFKELSIEEINANYTADLIVELSEAVTDFSGVDEDYEKKSELTLA